LQNSNSARAPCLRSTFTTPSIALKWRIWYRLLSLLTMIDLTARRYSRLFLAPKMAIAMLPAFGYIWGDLANA
jgi:hypothetical protein